MKKYEYIVAFILLLAVMIAGSVAAYNIGEDNGYRSGLNDGLHSTLLINTDNECEVLRYDRGQ